MDGTYVCSHILGLQLDDDIVYLGQQYYSNKINSFEVKNN
jgi:hypothetical protein